MIIEKAEIQTELIDSMGNDLTIVNSARVSYNKTKAQFDNKDEKLVKYLAKHQHYTPFEHCTATFRIKCPLYISKQIMRHRTFAYNEVSRRYTEENIEFYIPDVFRKQHEKSKQCSDGSVDDQVNCEQSYLTALQCSLIAYNSLLDNGVARELARGVLPNCTMTEFYMTGNLRNYAHFVKLRVDEHAQEEVQVIGYAMKDELEKAFPVGFKALMEE